MYKEIKRLTGNNKGFAEAALAVTVAECWWITGSETNVVYLRGANNDWVAIPDDYYDEGAEFTTTHGKSVILTNDADYNYIAVEA